METDKIYITKEVIDDVSLSELDFELSKEFGFDHDIHSEFVEIQSSYPDVTNEPIKIDLLIKTLQEIREKGATHISLNYHYDHIEYEMTGYKIYLSTQEQIKSYEDKLAINQEKKLKLKALREEYNRIENE